MTEQNHEGDVMIEEGPDTLLSVADAPVDRAVADEHATELDEAIQSPSDSEDTQEDQSENGTATITQERVLQKQVGGETEAPAEDEPATQTQAATPQLAETAPLDAPIQQPEAPDQESDVPTTALVEEPAAEPLVDEVAGDTVEQLAPEPAPTSEADAPPDDGVDDALASLAAPIEPPATIGDIAALLDAGDTPSGESETPTLVEEGTTPAAELTDGAVDGASAPQGDGASFTPVETKEVRPRRLKDLEVDMELEGRVTSIALYGIFVDVGVGRDGLVHISEMSNARITSPSDVVKIGDIVRVRVKSIDPEARRISLTMRTPRERPEPERRSRPPKRQEVDRDQLTTLKVGDVVDGRVTGLSAFGAFVDIGVGKDGLVHISELSEGRVDKPEDAVEVGQTYTFKLLEVDRKAHASA